MEIIAAEFNDKIVTKNGIKGIVEKVLMNSVIISITHNPTDTVFENFITVVNHKNYTIEKK